MKREVGQLPSQHIANPRNQPLGFPPQLALLPQLGPPQQKGPQFENAKTISTLQSGRVLEDSYKIREEEGNSNSKAHDDERGDEEELIKEKLGENDKGKEKLHENLISY